MPSRQKQKKSLNGIRCVMPGPPHESLRFLCVMNLNPAQKNAAHEDIRGKFSRRFHLYG